MSWSTKLFLIFLFIFIEIWSQFFHVILLKMKQTDFFRPFWDANAYKFSSQDKYITLEFLFDVYILAFCVYKSA